MSSFILDSALPVAEVLPDLKKAFESHRNVVLQAPPGAGKSTLVPLALLDCSWLQDKKLLMLEPRRLAARAIATRMATMLGEAAGQTVGYRTRLQTRVGLSTRIEVVTEGILTRMLQQDAAMSDVALVVFDEFHERSLQADLGLALCLDVQSGLRDDLRLLVMSATLSTAAVAALLDDAQVITSEGRAYPVEVRHLARSNRDVRDVPEVAARAVRESLAQAPGDALVFLPGQAEIRRTQELLKDGLQHNVSVLPLYGELDPAQQDLALQPSFSGTRKVVLATNIAETSLTIAGVRIVIDSGWERRARFDPASAMNRLETLRISRASAEQRTGRAGRLGSGVCYRLWSQAEQASLSAHTPAEILEVDLAALALELAAWGVRDLQQLRWLDTPPAAAFAQARDLLVTLGALDERGYITQHGRAMSGLGMHPRLAHMVLRGTAARTRTMACELAALLEERDIVRKDSFDADIDVRTRLDALRNPRSIAPLLVDEGARQRVLRSARRMASSVRAGGDDGDLDAGALLAYAYPDRVARRRDEAGRFLLANGRGASIAHVQSLSSAEYLAVASLDLREREARIRLAAPVSLETLEEHFSDRFTSCDRIQWDSRQRAVLARSERWLGAILVAERPLESPDRSHVLAALLEGIREMGPASMSWSREARQLRDRLRFAHGHDRDRAWPDTSDVALLANMEHWLAPWLDGVTRADQLARVNLESALRALLSYEQQRRLDAIAPTHLQVPSGSRIPIDYSIDQPFLAVRLQEVFGLQSTPRIADGGLPLTLHLLSPAHRPVQVTQDLASFWAHGYAEVKRELKGRYPRHYWPDDPARATTTARAKPRGT